MALPGVPEGLDDERDATPELRGLRGSIACTDWPRGLEPVGPDTPVATAQDRPVGHAYARFRDLPVTRLWKKPETYPNPTAEAARRIGYLPPAPDPDSITWAPVEMRHLTARGRADGTAGGYWLVDTCFPTTLRGNIDVSGVDEGAADALYGLVRLLAPKVVLETGTNKGRSTRAIASALHANAEWAFVPLSYSAKLAPGHVYTVDLHDYGVLTSGALLPRTESYVTQLIGRTPDILTVPPLDTLTGIDFAFLDGDHTAEGLDAEITYVDLHRAEECWVVVDNSRDPGWPDVAQTLRAWDQKYPRVSFGSCTGLDVIWMR